MPRHARWPPQLKPKPKLQPKQQQELLLPPQQQQQQQVQLLQPLKTSPLRKRKHRKRRRQMALQLKEVLTKNNQKSVRNIYKNKRIYADTYTYTLYS